MPYGLYGFGGNDNALDPQLQALLDSLEQSPAPTPPPEKPPVPEWQQALLGGTPRNFIGNLGDAIAAMAAVRAGGAPPQIGAYAAGQRQKTEAERQAMEDYQKRQEENAQAERLLRNQTKISAYERGQTLAGQKEIAAMKPNRANRLIPDKFTRNVGGTSRIFRRMLDPMTGAVVPTPDPETGEMMYEHDLGASGYAPQLQPGMVNEPGQPPRAAILNIPKGGGEATEVKGPGGARLEPPPPPGLATETGGKIGVLQGVPHLKEVFDKTDAEVRGNYGELSRVVNWAQAQTAGTRFQTLLQPVAMQKYYNEMRAILTPYVRSVSGLVFPEAELRRYESRMPIPGVTDPEVVDSQWESLISEMVRDIKGKYGATGRTPPPIPGAGGQATAAPMSPAMQEYENYKRSLGIGEEDGETP